MKFTSSLFPNTEYDQYKLDRYILYNKNKMRYFHKICLIVLIMSYSFPSASSSSVFELFTKVYQSLVYFSLCPLVSLTVFADGLLFRV